MDQTLPNVTDAEWSVLQLLWEKGPASVRRLTEVLYPKGGPSEYATVHKLLERLESKGYVLRDRDGGVYVFRAAVDREADAGQELGVVGSEEENRRGDVARLGQASERNRRDHVSHRAVAGSNRLR